MRGLSNEQWMLFGAFLGAVGVQLGGVGHWGDALTPPFIGGLIIQLGIVLRAMHTPKPQ